MSGLALLADAASRKLQAQDALAEANRDIARALRLVWLSGVPKCHVGPLARETLHGFGPEQMGRLGLSNGSVRLALA